MPATYDKIATATGTGSSNTITFTSIPSTYTDLVIILNGSLSAGANVRMTLNNDSGTNYSMTVLAGDGSSASSYRASNDVNFQYVGFTDTGISTTIIQVMNYSNTTTNKTMIQRNSKASNQAQAAVGLWRNTGAVNRLDLFASNSSTWTTSTTATIYGIKAA
jgi:hypothetical protein